MRNSDDIYRTALIVLVVGLIIFPLIFIAIDLSSGIYAVDFPFTLEYYPSFVATSTGVFLALFLDSFLGRRKDEESMSGIQEIIEKELKRGVENLNAKKGNCIETQVWDSLINSGRASLLPVDLQNLLFDIYAEIKAHNYEAVLTREDADDHRCDPTDAKRSKWELSSSRILEKEQRLQERVSSFLAMKLLTRKSVVEDE